jgi:hypothetical protein
LNVAMQAFDAAQHREQSLGPPLKMAGQCIQFCQQCFESFLVC